MSIKAPEIKMKRTADHPIESIFLERWSPRAFQPESMPTDHIHTILEAARWAPSAFNIQPWRFLYACREDDHWQTFLELLDPFNAGWAKNASVLVYALSDTLLKGSDGSERPLYSHSFDTGAAWAHAALQATALGYAAHGMAGIHFEKARATLRLPDRFHLEMAIAIGKQADPQSLPPKLQEREHPSGRHPLSHRAFAGFFPETDLT